MSQYQSWNRKPSTISHAQLPNLMLKFNFMFNSWPSHSQISGRHCSNPNQDIDKMRSLDAYKLSPCSVATQSWVGESVWLHGKASTRLDWVSRLPIKKEKSKEIRMPRSCLYSTMETKWNKHTQRHTQRSASVYATVQRVQSASGPRLLVEARPVPMLWIWVLQRRQWFFWSNPWRYLATARSIQPWINSTQSLDIRRLILPRLKLTQAQVKHSHGSWPRSHAQCLGLLCQSCLSPEPWHWC